MPTTRTALEERCRDLRAAGVLDTDEEHNRYAFTSWHNT